ncbi:MAG: helix-turn-helix domain-containing protein [Desulfatitalea sp.]|nr:helix-turn-helix domain-containing protein [Desulfatitalea sp.]
MENNNEVLNAKEAAIFLKAHVETLRRMARRGEIPAFKVGKDWRFLKKTLWLWMQRRDQDHRGIDHAK